MHGQHQRVTLRLQAKAQIGALGDDSLITHQAFESLGQGAAGHQRITHYMERCRTHHPGHVQANRLIARKLHRQLPQAGHGVLGKARVRIVQGRKIQPELLEHGLAIEPFQLERFDNP